MNTAAEFEKNSTTVTTALTELARLTSGGHGKVVCVEVENVSGSTLNGFTLQLLAHRNGAAFNFLVDTDFQGALNSNLRFCTTIGPNQIAAGQKAQFIVEIPANYQAIFLAKASATTAVISIRGTEAQGG